MYKILTLNKISETGLAVLPEDQFAISDKEQNPDGAILRSFSMHDMELPKSLTCVARAGAGVNNIPIDKCTEQGIVVFNTPGANANAVKELVVAALMMSSRKITEGINWAQSLKGQTGVAALVEKGKGEFVGPEIMGKTLGVVGLGAIGILVANAAVSLGMNVVGYDPFLSVDAAWNMSPAVTKAKTLDDLYAVCDYITIHVPFNKETQNMIDADALSKMKKGVRIVNISRGELVDDNAIKLALTNGQVSCYVTDFPNENVLGVPGIITIPHLGASSPESEENCAYMAALELKEFLTCGNIKNSVNFPNCELACQGKKRVSVAYKNAPEFLNQAIAALSDNKILASASATKKDVGYLLFDLENNENAASKLNQLNGVLAVRVLS